MSQNPEQGNDYRENKKTAMQTEKGKHIDKITAASLLIALGIIYGDIGTSPLYVLKAVVLDRTIEGVLVLGGVSCIFWTLVFQTTLKYIVLTLRADNEGEGGIFSLYSPNIDKIELISRGKVRRARLFYLRELTGKKARVKERRG